MRPTNGATKSAPGAGPCPPTPLPIGGSGCVVPWPTAGATTPQDRPPMSQFHSLQDQLNQLLKTLPPAKPKPPPGSAPVWTSYSDELPREAAERVRCARCKGTGLLGGSMIAAVDEEPWPCPS